MAEYTEYSDNINALRENVIPEGNIPTDGLEHYGAEDELSILDENSKDVVLKKSFYGIKNFTEKINIDFQEFLLDKTPISEFFDLYNRYFYELPKKAHNLLMVSSMNCDYPNGYKSNRHVELDILRKQLDSIQKEIDSVEREHFFLKNDTFIISSENSNEEASNGAIYMMQSGKKRLILNNDIYKNLKSRKRGGDKEDQNFLVYLDNECIEGIKSGPDINSLEDANIDPFIINIYPVTPENYRVDYDPQLIIETENDGTYIVNRGSNP